MKSKLLVRLIVSVSFCLSFVVSVSSQSPLWIYGNKLIHFSETGITTSNLPQPGPDQNLHYTGQIPTKGQNCQFDDQGNLLFFIIDGNIYDRNGYKIASYTQFLETPDENLFPNYFDDIAITNVPGFCDKYYIFSTIQPYENSTTCKLLCTLLDMNLQNPNFPYDVSKKGSLVNGYQMPDSNPLFYFFDVNNYPNNNTYLELASRNSICINCGQNSKNTINSIEIVEIDSDHKFVIISSIAEGTMIFELTPNNIEKIYNCTNPNFSSPETSHSCVQTILNGNSGFKFASFSACSNTQNSLTNPIFLHEYNPLSGLSFLAEISISSDEDDRVVGLEFSPDGTKLWFTKTLAPQIGVYDLITGVVSAPISSSSLPVSIDLAAFALSEMEGQMDETGNNVIYITCAAGLYKLTNPNNPSQAAIGNVSWANGLTPCSANAGNLFEQNLVYTIQVQNTGTPIIQDYLAGSSCCHDYVVIHDEAPTQVNTSIDGNWYNSQNPFQNQNSPIKIVNDLVFQTGTVTHIYNMTFEFDVNADVIIEKGASVYLHGTAWTSLSCEDIMWPGVDLLGTTNAANSIDQLPVSGGDQGYLNLSNSVIENAMIGIDVGGNVANNAGGIVRASNTGFKNNQNDVMFRKYHYQSGVNYIQNKSYFNSCTFVTDEHLNNTNLSPENHVYLNRVDKIQFRNCSFMNKTDISTYDWLNRGRGIFSYSSSFQVIGSNDPWSMSAADNSTSFYKLTYGIHSYGFNNLRSFYKCAKNEFQYCLYGIVNNNTDNVQIYLNNFTLPDAAGFTSNNTVERGIYLSNSTGYVVEQNFFDGSNDANVSDTYPCAMGIWVHNSGDESNEIRNNDFDEMRLGTYVTGNNIDYVQNVDSTPDTQSDQTGLQLLCNTYTNGRVDVFRGSHASMRWVQGGVQSFLDVNPNPNGIPAGNRFSSDECLGESMDFVCDPNNSYSMDYWCNSDDNATPDCGGISNTNGSQLLNVADEFAPYNNTDCPNHFSSGGVTPGPGIISNTVSQIGVINENLNQAKTSYKLIVDKNQKANTIEVLNEVFPHESQFYKDLLIQRFPLSDDVLRQVIANSTKLNQWHLTEVFLANCPLKKDVLAEISSSNILSSFFMNFLYQADTGMSLRTLMEMNITGLATERDKLIQSLAHEGLNYDSDMESETDQAIHLGPYLNQLENTHSIVHLRALASNLYSQGMYSDAIELIADEPLLTGLFEILNIANDIEGNWELIDSTQLEVLFAISKDSANYSSGIALAVLEEMGRNIEEPEPHFPMQQRSLIRQNTSDNNSATLLGIYPNPAKDIAYINYPIELDDYGFIQIISPDGRIVEQIKPNSQGLLELPLKKYDSGVYFVELVSFERVLESSMLFVVR